ncbi:aminopeptidase [Streptococcus sp. DD13]|uniref:aminopeptidase n=1 Tax=Streptococcus sp. DD13 TaxID=1777881 RepID=UPI0007937D65|nr:aminopeptidase [Streptococcus sp. DD13]KXT77569.1 Aminopeptidase S (Leu, Val, Phe, Tyr preference) [Streptococcus sp. DD13]
MVLPNFNEHLAKYAHLLVKRGINVQPGHTVALRIAVDQAPLARLIVKEAYALGASEVLLQWEDDFITRERYLHVPVERLEKVPAHRVEEMNYILETGASRLVILSDDPGNLDGIDPDKTSRAARAAAIALKPLRLASQANKMSWTLGAAASPAWAKTVFPDAATEEEAVDLLWDQIFKTCRVYEADPVQAWIDHEDRLVEKATVLNKEQFVKLHYTAPGTDLTLGLPKNHLWEAAGSINSRGEHFVANMPTEEVFTAPDYRVADGYVTSTKPLSYNGNIIEGIKVVFKDGEIVEASAEKGDEVIKKLVFENRGARALGEVALVPDKSPISQSNITFFTTLFDENASNHLAIGAAYAFSIEGGTEMSEEELEAAGLNRSDVHVDFMIGSDQMDVDGIREDGTVVPIFRQGDWAI